MAAQDQYNIGNFPESSNTSESPFGAVVRGKFYEYIGDPDHHNRFRMTFEKAELIKVTFLNFPSIIRIYSGGGGCYIYTHSVY